MRVALISDIHGNDIAFQAVLADIEYLGVDSIVSLGDVAQGGPQPARVLDRMRALGCGTVMGNSDAFLLEVPTDSNEPITELQLEVRDWTLASLDEGHLDFIRSFSPTVAASVNEHRILCFHGSPRSYEDMLVPQIERASLAPFEGYDAFDLIAGGHTHTQWTRRIGETLFVNPGSVGVPYDRHQPDDDFRFTAVAEYAVVLVDELGLGVEFRRVPFSLDAFGAATRAGGRPHAESYLADWRAGDDR